MTAPRCPECHGHRVELVDVDQEHDDPQLDDACLDLLARLAPDEVVLAFAWCWSCGYAEADVARVDDVA